MLRFCKRIAVLFFIYAGLFTNSAKAQVVVGDSLALVALYNSTDGPNWTNNSNWLVGTVDTWFGITVGANRVTEIKLDGVIAYSGNNLVGTIPVDLGNLSNLTSLDLGYNQLTGSIPIELGNLSNLTFLAIEFNVLTGSIPSELENLNGLTSLLLEHNLFSGSIPPELGNLSNLTTMYLSNNQLTGGIPIELGNLTNLTILYLARNQLTGGIPIELSNLTNLSTLNLGDNPLNGSIPIELGNLTNLTELSLWDNQLTGGIPIELVTLTSLTTLVLGGNQLTGNIPIELGSLTNLTKLHLWFNQFTGSIPIEIGNLINLTELSFYSNQLTGDIPIALANLTSLRILELAYNQLTGSIPIELGNLSNLTDLNLSDNQLSGVIPVELGNISSLTHLQLSNNQLSGTVPTELSNLANLIFLLLENNLLNDLPDLSGLTNFTTLKAESNFFEFDELEPYFSLPEFTYSPQNPIGSDNSFIVKAGGTHTLSVPVGGSSNQYQWQKDGVDVPGATDDFLWIADIDNTDTGVYNLLITSPLVPGLILSSANQTVSIMAPDDYYWVGDGGVWTDLSHWSSTSGGSPDQIALPSKLDDVFFDLNSFSLPGQIVSIIDKELPSFEGETWKNMDWTGVTNNPTFQISTITSPWIYNNVYGSLIFDQNMTLDFRGAEFYFYSDQDYVIDTKGLYLGDNCWLYVNAPEDFVIGSGNDVVCDVLSDINPAGVLIDKGTMRLNGHNLYEKDSYVWARGDGSVFDITGSFLDVSNFVTWNATDVTIIDDDATIMVSTLLQTDGVFYNHVILTDSAQVLQYSNTFDTLEIAPGANIQFESEVTQNVVEFVVQGTFLLPILISATKLDTAAIISKLTGRVDASHVSFKDNTAVGGALFNAYSSIDLGNTTGWNFRKNSAQDSLTLLTLFNATGGPGWVNSTNWNTVEPFSTWYGVTVNDSSRVSGISLAFNNLSGTIPPEIGDLPELTFLWLGRNSNLQGQIPPELGQLNQLDTLGLSYSGLTGTIPDELYNLTNLTRFSMSNSQVTGSLSPRIANLTNLKHIALWNTPLSGEIPNEFWDMTGLERIYLGTNQQGGEISTKIGDFINLEEFWISGCNLSGVIPPEIGNASSTTLINLYDNKLSGPVPDEITTLTELKTFGIQNNDLNYLPDLTGLDSLQSLNISNNKFTYADILPNQDLITVNTSQKPFGDSTQVQAYTFEGLRLDPELEFIDGQQYQWYKDGSVLANGNSRYYEIDDFREPDGGVYFLEVTHPDVASFVLTRNPMQVIVNEGNPPKPEAVKVISPNGDGINDEMTIKNIELYPNHRVLIYDVLGRLVYETSEYDNINNPFIGIGNQNGFDDLPSGTYYYLIDVGDTKKNGTGFFVMKKR